MLLETLHSTLCEQSGDFVMYTCMYGNKAKIIAQLFLYKELALTDDWWRYILCIHNRCSLKQLFTIFEFYKKEYVSVWEKYMFIFGWQWQTHLTSCSGIVIRCMIKSPFGYGISNVNRLKKLLESSSCGSAGPQQTLLLRYSKGNLFIRHPVHCFDLLHLV